MKTRGSTGRLTLTAMGCAVALVAALVTTQTALADQAMPGFTPSDPVAAYGADGTPYIDPVLQSYLSDVSDSGETVVTVVNNSTYSAGGTGRSFYAYKPAEPSSGRIVAAADSSNFIDLSGDGRYVTWDAVSQGSRGLWTSSLGGTPRQVPLPGDDSYTLTWNLSENGRFALIQGRHEGAGRWYLWDRTTDATRAITSEDSIFPNAIGVADNGVVFGYLPGATAENRHIVSFSPLTARWEVVPGSDGVLNSSGDVILDTFISPAGTAIAQYGPSAFSSARAFVTHTISYSGELRASMQSSTRREAPKPDFFLAQFVTPFVPDDGRRVAAGNNGHYFIGEATASGGVSQMLTPAGERSATSNFTISKWSGDLQNALYVDNGGRLRLGRPFSNPSGVAPTPTPTPPPVSSKVCHEAAIVAFRGSGERNVSSGVKDLSGKSKKYANGVVTNGWEGPTLSRLISGYASQSYGGGFDPASVPIIALGTNVDGTLGYPAVAVPKSLNMNPVRRSAKAGRDYAARVMEDFRAAEPAGCTTKFIFIGYSQGAMADRAAASVEGAPVAAVLNVGDPFQYPKAEGVAGDGRAGMGVFRRLDDGQPAGSLEDRFYRGAYIKRSICHKKDPYCRFGARASLRVLLKDNSAHESYFKVNGEKASMGRLLGEVARNLTSR